MADGNMEELENDVLNTLNYHYKESKRPTTHTSLFMHIILIFHAYRSLTNIQLIGHIATHVYAVSFPVRFIYNKALQDHRGQSYPNSSVVFTRACRKRTLVTGVGLFSVVKEITSGGHDPSQLSLESVVVSHHIYCSELLKLVILYPTYTSISW